MPMASDFQTRATKLLENYSGFSILLLWQVKYGNIVELVSPCQSSCWWSRQLYQRKVLASVKDIQVGLVEDFMAKNKNLTEIFNVEVRGTGLKGAVYETITPHNNNYSCQYTCLKL